MGYLFENAEKMDIQAERRNTQKLQKKLDETRDELDQIKDELDQTKDTLKTLLKNLIRICKQKGINQKAAKIELQETYNVDTDCLNLYFEELWNKE